MRKLITILFITSFCSCSKKVSVSKIPNRTSYGDGCNCGYTSIGKDYKYKVGDTLSREAIVPEIGFFYPIIVINKDVSKDDSFYNQTDTSFIIIGDTPDSNTHLPQYKGIPLINR